MFFALIVLLGGLFFTIESQALSLELRGTAQTLDKKTILYKEIHQITRGENGLSEKIETKYIKPDGEHFATMTSDFSKNKTVPKITFEDMRLKKKEELLYLADGKSLLLKTSEAEAPHKEKIIVIQQNMVVGQGFDNYIKINFEKLTKGTLALFFGVIDKLDFFSFKAYKIKHENINIARFGIRVKNVFARLFVDEIQVEYDPKTRQLLTYKGLSNIFSDQGQPQNVLIEYTETKKYN